MRGTGLEKILSREIFHRILIHLFSLTQDLTLMTNKMTDGSLNNYYTEHQKITE